MKRQNSSNNKSILHFFKSNPRALQEKSPAAAAAAAAATNTSDQNASQPPGSSSTALPDRARTAAPGPAISFDSNTSTAAAMPTAEDTVMTLIETLPPTTSQTSANSGASKRVLSRGEPVVLNSDSDSDSDSLGDLEFGLPAPKPLKTPTYTGRSTRRTAFEDEPELRRPPKTVRNNGKRSFNQLMETAEKNLDTEKKIQERKAELAKIDDESVPVATDLNKDTFKQAMQAGDDSDQADRLYKAMQRTNEVRAHNAYHFFDDTPKLSLIPPFPQKSLPAHRWAACFDEPSTRDQAFMTGFAHEMFRLQQLPKELATWMIDQICLGHNPALDQKYLEILQTHDEQLRKQLSLKRLNAMFTTIGAQVESLEMDAEISPAESQAQIEHPIPTSLKRVAMLLTSAAPSLHSKARTHAFQLLCHTCLDDRILLDSHVLNCVQDAIEAIVCQYADNHNLTSSLMHVIPKLLSRVTHPRLQANLIHAFPARSPLTAYLQRYLALSFLLYPNTVDVALIDPQLPELIHAHLDNSPHYRMSKHTDYSHVAARLTLLDIAIGPGPTTVPYLPLISPPPSETGSSPPLAPIPVSSDVKVFNREVDALAQHIKLIGNSIVETGAALDLTILEAKERCERLFWRLQHAVRIGGKQAENVFGDDDEKQLKVKKFFKPLPKKPVKKESIFDQDGDAEVPA